MKKAHIIYLSLSVIFLISGMVFLIVCSMENLTEFNPLYTFTTGGFTKLRYYELFLTLAVSLLICAVCFLIIWIVSKFTRINGKFTAVTAILVVALFCSSAGYAGINALNNYSEKGVYTDISDDYQQPAEEYLEFFPYFDDMKKITDAVPYYSLTEYKLNNSILRTSQIYTDSVDENAADITVTTDYFESNKSYMMTKYTAEKIFYETTDEYGNTLNSSSITERDYEDHKLIMILLETEKRFIIKNDAFYFSIIIQDNSNSLNINEEEFVNLAIEQFELISDSNVFNNMPNIL